MLREPGVVGGDGEAAAGRGRRRYWSRSDCERRDVHRDHAGDGLDERGDLVRRDALAEGAVGEAVSAGSSAAAPRP